MKKKQTNKLDLIMQNRMNMQVKMLSESYKKVNMPQELYSSITDKIELKQNKTRDKNLEKLKVEE
jgi:hypothetical protein